MAKESREFAGPSGANSLIRRPSRISFFRWEIAVTAYIAGLAYALAKFGKAVFFTNDDTAMMGLAKGVYTGEPESQLVFISQPIGTLLSFLYSEFPEHLWYQNLLLLTYSAALLLLAFAVRDSVIGRWGWIGLSLSFFPWLVLNPTFTTAAFVAGVAGALVVMRERSTSIRIFGLFLLLIGVGWRPIVFIPVLLSLAGFAVARIIAGTVIAPLGTKIRQEFRRFLPPVALALLFGVILSPQLGANEAWQDYFEYNETRGDFHDTPRGAILRDSPQEVWTKAEIQQFQAWLLFDEQIHGPKFVSQLEEDVPSLGESLSEGNLAYLLQPSELSKQVKKLSDPNSGYVFFLLVYWSLLYFWIPSIVCQHAVPPRVRFFWVLPLQISPLLPLFFFRITTPVIVGLLFSAAASALLLWSDRHLAKHFVLREVPAGLPRNGQTPSETWQAKLPRQNQFRKPNGLFLILPLLVGYWSPVMLLATESPLGTYSRGSHIESMVNNFNDWSDQNLKSGERYIASDSYLNFGIGTVWGNEAPKNHPNVLPMGWLTFSPHWDKRLNNSGLSNLDSRSLASGDLFFVGTVGEASTLAESVGISVEKELAFSFESGTPLYGSISIFSFHPVR